ncbi:hypothetical protein KJ840_02065 [Patescibacteria group bacterium]|nr:hypothetical protein [Patescibacteria group bacterium]
MKIINIKKRKFIISIIVLVLIITLLPYIGVYNSNKDYYTGGTLVGAADKMVYLSQIEEARQGYFFIHNLYTSEPQAGYFSPLWASLGWFSGITKLPPLFTYHLFRVIFGFIFLYLLYLFVSKIFLKETWRKIAFVTLAISSGFGFFTFFINYILKNPNGYFGADIWYSEGNTFLTLFHSPLFILSQICLLLIFWWTIARFKIAKYPEVIGMGIIGCLLGFFHPYDVFIAFFILSVWFIVNIIKNKLWPWPDFFKLVIFFLISFASIFYFFIFRIFSPGFAGWAEQLVQLSPPPHNYMAGFGLIFIFFLFGISPAWKSKNKYLNFLAVWSLTSWLLLYMPLSFQRRLGNGMHIPMALLAVLGAAVLLDKIKKTKLYYKINNKFTIKIVILIIFIFLMTSTNLFFLGLNYHFFSIGEFHLTKGEKEAIWWLKENSDKSDIILSQSQMGSIIPSIAGRFVYLGYKIQTNNWLIKKYDVEEWFFKDNRGDKLKARWLSREGIDYLYYGSREMALGEFNPQNKEYLKQVFQNSEVAIYQVKPVP